jgi:hypothetical protein
VAAAVAALVGVAGPGPAGAAPSCSFKVVGHPNSAATEYDQLNGIDAASAKNVWAVGSSEAAGEPLTLHFNGSKWKLVPAPDKGATTELEDVTVLGPANAWAVGYYSPSGGGHIKTLVEHWNGTKWAVVASPSPISGGDNFLFGVDAVSASNVWAVGSNGRPGTKTLIEHWNGHVWASVHGASLPVGGNLSDVAAISAKNVLAVGHVGVVGSTDALVERFDGSSWTRVPAPTNETGADLAGISAPSATAEWAAGSRGGTAAIQTLAMRNTGSGWTEVPSPNVGGNDTINYFNDVGGVSATLAWAVGEHDSNANVRRTLVEHFTNGSWDVVASPNSGSGDNQLFAVDAVTNTNVWAVGKASHPIGSTGLILHGC